MINGQSAFSPTDNFTVAVNVTYIFVGQVVAGIYNTDVLTYAMSRLTPRLCVKKDELDYTDLLFEMICYDDVEHYESSYTTGRE